MNFDFSQEQAELRAQVKKLLERKSPPKAVRAILEGSEPFDRELWAAAAEMGLTGVTIPEEFGGLGLGYLELCVIAEEFGRALAPIPYASSIYLAAELLLLAGSPEQKQAYLPKLAAGEAIGCFAFAETAGAPNPETLRAFVTGGMLTGAKGPVADGDVADFAVVAARPHPSSRDIALFIVDLDQDGVTRTSVKTIDPTRSHAQIAFDNALAQAMTGASDGWAAIQAVLDRAAALVAFEQLGGADRALEMARDYALDRMAFGRPIGSFQAVKHMLADMYIAATLARSNCYFGAWALSTNAPELPEAAAAAHVSATQAFQLCARNNIQTHGGMGFTWESDCSLFFRRANLLALSLGGPSFWEKRLVQQLRAKLAA